MNDLSQARKLIKECRDTQKPYLNLRECEITDLEELPELFECKHLDILILSENHISDIRLLSDLTGLQSLNLWGNKISDIRSLENLFRLQSLDLSHNQISDIRSLENLTRLQSLNLSQNQISDVSFLANLTGLQFLDLSYNHNKKIPLSIFQLNMKINMEQYPTEEGLCLYNNPIDSPPLEIIKQG